MHLLRRRIFALLILLLIIIGAYFGYKHIVQSKDDTLKFIPSGAAFVLQVPIRTFSLNNISNNSYWNQLTNIPSINKYSEQLFGFESLVKENKELLKYIRGSNLYVSVFPSKSNEFGLLYAIKLNKEKNETSIANIFSKIIGDEKQKSKRIFNGVDIIEYTLNDNRNFSYSIIENYLIASFTSFLIDDAVAQHKNKNTLGYQNTYAENAMLKSDKFELKVLYKNLPQLLKVFSDDRAGESGIDVLAFYNLISNYNLTLDSSSINGISSEELRTPQSFVTNFSNQNSQQMNLFDVLPVSTSMVKHVSVTDQSTWIENLKNDRSKLISGYSIEEYLEGLNNKYKANIQDYLTSWCKGNYAQVIIEPVNSNYDEFVFAFFEANDIEFAINELTELASISSFTDNPVTELYGANEIVTIDIKGVLPLLYGNIFNKVQSLTFTHFNDYILFGNSAEALKRLLDELNSKRLLREYMTKDELDFVRKNKPNYFIYINFSNSESVIRAHLKEQWSKGIVDEKLGLNILNAFMYSYVNKSVESKSKFVISFSSVKANNIKLAWKSDFENTLITKPFLVKNVSSKIYKILVQDAKFTLHCLDETGKKLWQKQLSDKIINNINVLDIRNNGQTQFLFNTSKSVYLIDDKGANVLNYPIKLPVETDMNLEVLSNKKTKDISYYVYCSNKHLYAYNINGRTLNNWIHRGKELELARNIQAFTHSGAPALMLCYKSGDINLCNSKGNVLINAKHDLPVSSNNLFYSNGKENSSWISTDELGNVLAISNKGKLTIVQNPSLSKNHTFYFEDLDRDSYKDFIYLDESEFTAYDQDMIMILYKKFSEKINPFISFSDYAQNEERIGVVSEEANKLFVFDLNGINYGGFPIDGSSEFSIVDLQNSGNLNLVCVSQKNKLFNYKIK